MINGEMKLSRLSKFLYRIFNQEFTELAMQDPKAQSAIFNSAIQQLEYLPTITERVFNSEDGKKKAVELAFQNQRKDRAKFAGSNV